MKEFLDNYGFNSDLKNHETTYFLANQVFDNIHAFVFIFDFEKKIPVWINKYYETRMGYSVKDLKNLNFEMFCSLFHPDSLKVFIDRISKFNTSASSDKKTIYKLKTSDGNWINVMISSSILKKNNDDSIKYLLGYGVEIINGELSKKLVELHEIESKSSEIFLLDRLSKREIEIIAFIANCYTDKEIAEKLKISVNTSKTHRKRIINKLGLKNTASLVKFAIEYNIV